MDQSETAHVLSHLCRRLEMVGRALAAGDRESALTQLRVVRNQVLVLIEEVSCDEKAAG